MFTFIYEQSLRADVLVHAYTLLDSQIHLLVTPKSQDSLSKMMQGLGRSYVRYFNNRYDRSGTLWGGRFKSSVVQTGEWLKKCLTYMDYLPVWGSSADSANRLLPATLPAQAQQVDPAAQGVKVQTPADYEWSSHLHYTGRRNDVFLTAHADVWNLGNTPFAREEQYELLIRKGLSGQELLHIEQTLKGGWILGDDTFIEHLQRSTHRRVAKAKPGRPSKASSAPSSGTLTD
jgi:putative transposase